MASGDTTIGGSGSLSVNNGVSTSGDLQDLTGEMQDAIRSEITESSNQTIRTGNNSSINQQLRDMFDMLNNARSQSIKGSMRNDKNMW